MADLFSQNPSVVFFMIGGVCTVVAMLIGVLLIRKSDSNAPKKPVYKKNNK